MREGSCNCGAITLAVTSDELQICHCIDCRKFTGAIGAYLLIAKEDDLIVTGRPKEYIKISDTTGSPAIRYFCSECGSSLYDTGSNVGLVFVQAGLFPPGSLPAPSREIFIKHREEWETAYPGVEELQGQ